MPPLLELTGITISLNGNTILNELSFELASGEIHALLGTNGSGKSSLAQMVMGCAGYTPRSGRIFFAGEAINDWPIHRRALAGIGLAWQEPARFEGLSVRNYLSLGTNWAPPEYCLEAVGLSPARYLAREVDKRLSGGERKRIELAAMLAMQPRLAILDEPAAGIDLISMADIMDAIRHLKQGEASVLLITHQEEIAIAADRASQLCAGQIVMSGKPEEVVENYRQRTCIRCDGSCADHG